MDGRIHPAHTARGLAGLGLPGEQEPLPGLLPVLVVPPPRAVVFRVRGRAWVSPHATPRQLVNQSEITPGSIHNPAVLAEGKEEYMYLSAVAFVKQASVLLSGVKWHSGVHCAAAAF